MPGKKVEWETMTSATGRKPVKGGLLMSDHDEKTAARKRPVQYELINSYDDIVKLTVRELMNSTDMCKCERCFLDVCAIVFNRGYTHFVNTREGELLKKIPDMNLGNRVEMQVQVMQAMKLVRSFPHHDA